MAQQALNFAQRKNSTLNFLTENDFLQEEKIVVVKSKEEIWASWAEQHTAWYRVIFKTKYCKVLYRAPSDGAKFFFDRI